jgi:hypothetical protein
MHILNDLRPAEALAEVLAIYETLRGFQNR